MPTTFSHIWLPLSNAYGIPSFLSIFPFFLWRNFFFLWRKFPSEENLYVLIYVLLHPETLSMMHLKTIILLHFALMVLAILFWTAIRVWRYRRDHPDEFF